MKDVQDIPLALLCDLPYREVPAWYNATRRTLHLDLVCARDKSVRPAILWFCGGVFQQMDYHLWMPELFKYAEQGFAVASAEYRVGILGQWPAAVEDAWAAIEYLRKNSAELGIDPDRIAVMGESAGGLLATSLGLGICRPEGCAPVQACVNFYGVTNLRSMAEFEKKENLNSVCSFMNGMPQEKSEIYRKANPLENVSSLASPFLILHGSNDKRVPIKQSEELRDRLMGCGVFASLLTIPGAVHGDSQVYCGKIREKALEFRTIVPHYCDNSRIEKKEKSR